MNIIKNILTVLFMLLISTSSAAVKAYDDTEQINIKRNNHAWSSTVLKEELDTDHGRPARAGSLIVTFKANTDDKKKAELHLLAGALISERLYLKNSERAQVKQANIKKALAYYRSLPDVLYAEPDLIARAMFIPSDSSFSNQWGMSKINAPQAWDISKSNSNVRIAILDCGIFSETASNYKAYDGLAGHPDLRNKVISNINFTTAPNADDFCNHGTHVAGIAASNTDNNLGVAGVGFNSKLINIKVLGDNGSGSFSWIINGILWAAGCNSSGLCDTNKRADVINLSLGTAASCPAAVQNAIDTAFSRGLVIVAAAGNSNTSGAITPANCNNVIAVAASDENDARASFSNFGPDVDVAAPGVAILSSDHLGNYSYFSGTSMASPHVAGLAALLWSVQPYNASNYSIVERILNTSDQSKLAGSSYGRIDALASLQGSSSPPADISPPFISLVTPSSGATEVLANTNISAIFSEDLNASTINNTTFSLLGPTGLVASTVSYNSSNQTATLMPTSPLAGSTSYTASVNTMVKDLAGNSLSQNKVWSFSTKNLITQCTSPTIISHSDTKKSGSGTVSFSWNQVIAATKYDIQRQRSDGLWTTRTSTTNTSYSGSDVSYDPKWRVYVSAGSCTPLPGPATEFDP